MIDYIFLGASSFLLSLLFIGFARLVFPKLALLDQPHKYGHDRPAVPYSVGILLFFVFVFLSIIYLDFSINLFLLLSAAGILVLTAFLDDYFKLSPILRLIVQLLAAMLAYYAGAQVLEVSNPFGGSPVQLGFLSAVVSVFWIILLTNLLNFLDGVSGLSTGVSAIGFFFLFGLSIWPNVHVADQTEVSTMSIILACIALVAAIFEFPKPKILVGDSGAMFFGFMLGVLSLINGGKLATVALILIVPIFDGLWVISRRMYSKKSPFHGDLGHMHHRLLELGFKPSVLLSLYYSISILFGLIALFSWNTFFKVTSLVLLFIGLIVFSYLMFYGPTRRNKS